MKNNVRYINRRTTQYKTQDKWNIEISKTVKREKRRTK